MSNSSPATLPSPDRTDVVARLREALLAASFTADGLLDLLGAPAYAALARSETVPALRATRGDTPLETLVRLFLLQQPVPHPRVAGVLPVDACVEAGWLVRTGGDEIAATVDVRPYGGPGGGDWFIVSDLGCAVGGSGGVRASARWRGGGGRRAGSIGNRDEGVVLGVGGASTTLAGITVRTPVGSALDLGTGSGIQALHAVRHATRVTATDVNPRALHITALTLALSGAPAADLREGSLFEPVRDDETFDLIVSNPPFVISPSRLAPSSSPGSPSEGAPFTRLTYRDGGMGGDDLCRTLVQQAGERLNGGGFAQFLANWQHVEGEDWQDRLRSWVPRGCDAWIVQRDVQDITQYAELWLRDAGDHRGDTADYQARYDAWLDEFEARKVRAVGFGWIALRRTDAAEPSITVEEWPHPVEQPLGDTVRAHFDRIDYLRAHDDAALLAGHFRLAAEVVQEQVGLPGAEDPEHVVLRQNRGMRRATKVDTVGAGFAGVCDGSLSAGRILDAIAQLVGEDPVSLRDRTPAQIRLLVEQGFLEPGR
ncbi:class I SAM-dependent methyltransferase [Streptomyces nodosus]|uniref:class I SAM-dependent methyltransferase n=1 Tax=Streptomyces nodosus TaxID=40318 RepID=UPI0034533181